jgi:uncharacterized protein YbbK (DUF523 family)
VSACLWGLRCRYDGASREDAALRAALAGRPLLLVCPEQLGGLPTPRPPAEIRPSSGAGSATGADVLAGRASVLRPETGEAVTDAFVRGATRGAALALRCGVRHAILKSRSPACGVSAHYERGRLVPGAGVFAAALRAAGLSLEER